MKGPTVDINDCGEFEVLIHIKGLKTWRFRIWLAMKLIQLANLVAPRNVYVTTIDNTPTEKEDNEP